MSMDKGSSPWNTISISLATPMDASFRSRSAFCGDRGASEGLGGRASGHSSAGQDGMERWIGFGIIGSRSAPYRSGSGEQESQEASGLRRKRLIEGQKEQAASFKNQITCSRVPSQANLCVLHRILVLGYDVTLTPKQVAS